jgi:hypothetical protein
VSAVSDFIAYPNDSESKRSGSAEARTKPAATEKTQNATKTQD